MATKSFTTEFKFNRKSANGLINAIENSHRKKHTIKQKVNTVSDEKNINNIMDSFLKGN